MLLYLGTEAEKHEIKTYFLRGEENVNTDTFYQRYVIYESVQRIKQVHDNKEKMNSKDLKMSLNFCGNKIKVDYQKVNEVLS